MTHRTSIWHTLSAVLTTLGVVCICSAVTNAQPATAIRVLVWTAESRDGFVDPDVEARRDSVADVRRVLRDQQGIVAVDTAEQADITIEVVSRELVHDDARRSSLPRGLLRLRLRAGDYEAILEGRSGSMASGHWSSAAKAAGTLIQTWVRQNRDRVLARRAK